MHCIARSFHLSGKFRWGQRDLLLVEGGTDRDREVAGRVQHAATALGARLQTASAGGLEPPGPAKSNFTAYGCDVDSLIETGAKTPRFRP